LSLEFQMTYEELLQAQVEAWKALQAAEAKMAEATHAV
jgi:hypothetical protein